MKPKFLILALLPFVTLAAVFPPAPPRAVAPKYAVARAAVTPASKKLKALFNSTTAPVFTPPPAGISNKTFKVGDRTMWISVLPATREHVLPPLPPVSGSVLGMMSAAVVPTNEWFRMRIYAFSNSVIHPKGWAMKFCKSAHSTVLVAGSRTAKFDPATEVVFASVSSWPTGPGYPTEMLITLGEDFPHGFAEEKGFFRLLVDP